MKYLLLFILCVLPIHAEYSQTQVVAAVIIAEAGGEGEVGMRAVASVIQNRITAHKNAFGVVSKPYQFSCLNDVIVKKDSTFQAVIDKAAKHKRWAYALELANLINMKKVEDNTGGSTHYHTAAVHPSWDAKMTFKKKIGNHLFFKE